MHDKLLKAPGPSRWKMLSNLRGRISRPLNFYLDLALQYGPVVSVQVGVWKVYCISDPDGLKRIFLDNVKNYSKGPGFARLRPIFGNGLLTSDGEFWRRQRKLAQPAFHMQSLMKMFGQMRELTSEMLTRWDSFPKDKSFNVVSEMMRVTLSIVSQTMLGKNVRDMAEEVQEAFTIALAEGSRRLFAFFPNSFPTPANRRGAKAIKMLDSVVYDIINERRQNPGDYHDLLGMFMSARDEETGEGMNERQLRDEVMTIFLAGHETTANALSWTWMLLGQNPDVYEKMKKEVDAVLAGKIPNFEDLNKLHYTKQVFEESLRLYPPAWSFSRAVVDDDAIAGYRVPKGALAVISPYLMHHHPKYWDQPEKFDPDRFTPENIAKRHKYVYIPFGGGPRTCIGNQFAMMEALLILSMVTQRYELALEPNQNIKPEALITLRPSPGVEVRLIRR